MSLLKEITAKSIELRKARSPLASTLTTLKGELETKQKTFKTPRDLSEDEVIASVKKTVKTLEENISLYNERGMSAEAEAAKQEVALLETFLPVQMSDEEIRRFAEAKIADGANMGQVMGALKAEKPGLYDGKVASALVRELLA